MKYNITERNVMKKAFTLAEVLITLGIIGVVAAMTLPALTAKYKEKILITQIKRAYSDLQNALKLYAVQNECSDISCISDTNSTTNELTVKLYSQFKGAKFCDITNNSKQCVNTLIKASKPIKDGNGNLAYSDNFRKPFFISANGAAFQVAQYNQCPRDIETKRKDENGNYIRDADGNIETYTTTSNVCALLYFDANGTHNGPNQKGADVYVFSILSNGKVLNDGWIWTALTKGKLNYTPYEPGQAIK